jgi:septal ring factor EnvC (AmiA/AmiB activator)
VARRLRPSVLLGATLLAVALPALFIGAGAQDGPPAAPDRQPSREEELARIRGEIARLRGEIAGLERRESGAAGALERAELELRLQEERIAEASAAREVAALRVAGHEAEVARLGERLAAVREDLRRRLVGLYRLGRHGYLRLALSLEPGGDLLGGVRLLRLLVRRDAETFDRYHEARARLDEERQALVARRQEVERWVEREEARRGELAGLVRRQEAVVARLAAERRSLADRAAELADREQKLAAFVDFLYGASADPLAGVPIQGFRGVLDWPAPGRVTVGFGPRRDPRYRTAVPHNGIEVATTPGAEVRTVYPGKVIFASPFRGYGPTAVVHHPGRVFALYAGLAELRVGRGDVVSLNDVIGSAAETLYFEIRVENRPEDPRGWLR